ncbi:MAG: InlB B-repeat-containing protein [Clostridiales bacterium]|nr:InlB B-repeat-containing protein [Clostridiales bacterium]
MNLPFIGEVETPVRAGSYTGSTNMAFYVDSGYKDLVIFMHMNKDGSGGEPQKYTHKLIYDANGGNGGPQDESSEETTNTSYTFTVSSAEPTRENYTFLGWADTADATVAQYNADSKITVSGTKTIYAVWESSINPPTYEELKGLVGKVAVNCITGTEHGKIEYDLIEGSYIPGVIGTDGDGNYTYSITIKPESYVATYEETNGGHTLDPDTQAAGKPVTFVWDTEVEDENKWVLAGQTTVPVVFTVKHDTSVPGSVSEVTKTRLTTVPQGVTLPNDVTINKEETVTFTDNNTSAKLLYAFTVTGTPGTEVTIADSGAKFFKQDNTTVGDSIDVTIGENGTATVYGYKTFTKFNIQEGNLKNTATATNKANQDDNATGSSDVPAEDKTTEITGEVKNVEKKRILVVPQGVTLPSGVDINVEPVVTFTDNNPSATLLYEFTVKGTADTVVTIADNGAKFFKSDNTTVGDSIEVKIGENGAATVYGYKTFTRADIQEGKLKNTATATNKANPDDKATGSSDVPAEYKTTEITGEVKNVEKKRILAAPNGVTLPNGVTINTDETVTFTDDNTSATLLYAFTVTGTPDAKVEIKDDGATFIDNGKSEITVTLPAAVEKETETSTTVYGYRTFSVGDIRDGKLVNTATANVEGDDNNKKEAKAEVDAKDNRTLYNTLTVKKLVSGNAASTTEEFPFKATFTFPVLVASPTQDDVTYDEDKTVVIDFKLAHDRTKTFSYTSDQELQTMIDKWREENTAYMSLTGDVVFAMLRYKVEETDTKGYTLTTNGDAEGTAVEHKTVTFTNTKNKPNDDHGGHYHPTTTPVPVIVIPPKTGDMPFWYSIAQFLGLVK